MAKKRRVSTPVQERQDVTVVVCRGGDCGSRRKHPEVDHLAQLRMIRARAGAGVEVLTSKCLDACDYSNVVVVLPGAAGRESAGEPVWIGEVNDPESTKDLVEWANQGGPGLAEEPVLVEIKKFSPTRLSRHELETDAIVGG